MIKTQYYNTNLFELKREQAGFLFVSLHDAEHAPKKKLISPPAPFASPYRYTMPAFYETDSIYTWMRVCVVEHWEWKASDKEEAKEYKKRISTVAGLKEEGEEFLIMSGVTSSTLTDAIMNTIDWGELLEDVLKDIDDEEDDVDA